MCWGVFFSAAESSCGLNCNDPDKVIKVISARGFAICNRKACIKCGRWKNLTWQGQKKKNILQLHYGKHRIQSCCVASVAFESPGFMEEQHKLDFFKFRTDYVLHCHWLRFRQYPKQRTAKEFHYFWITSSRKKTDPQSSGKESQDYTAVTRYLFSSIL